MVPKNRLLLTCSTIFNIIFFPKQIRGEWSGRTAGGCENHRQTYPNNPKYIVTIPESRNPCHLVAELKGPKQYQMGVDAKVESLDDPNLTAPFLRESSGPYRYVVFSFLS